MRPQTPARARAARRRPSARSLGFAAVACAVIGAAALAAPAVRADVEPPPAAGLRSLLDPAGDVAGGNLAVIAATTEHMIAAATPTPAPPAACPAPESEFVDSWGFARSGGRRHKGVDMMAPHGSPVLAPVGGTIRSSSSALGGLGFYLEDEDGNTYFGSHLATLVVDSGWVDAGTLIGTVGSTGNASTPHLHFEVMLAGTGSVNPYPFALGWCAPPSTATNPF